MSTFEEVGATPLVIGKPNRKFMFARLSHLIALGFGSGLSPIAPGTAGTLWAWVTFILLNLFLSEWQWGVVIALGFLIGCWACSKTGADLGAADHGAMVWDEIIAFWLILLLIPSSFGWQLAAFVAFRFFDAVKPPPVSWADRHFKGGFGVMFDDLVAAAMTLFLLAFFKS
jgi:phosphatidylglycerophosphatase A